MPKTREGHKLLQVWFTDAEYEQLKQLAESDQRTVSNYLRVLIKKEIERK